MMRQMLKAKIHRAVVTDADLNYEGSISIDEALMDAADIIPYEKVLVLDIANGERAETYVIRGKRNSGDIILNGAIARLMQVGDPVIILAFASVDETEARRWKPVVVIVDEKNRIGKRTLK